MDKNNTINLQELSGAIKRAIGCDFIVHTSKNDWGGSVLTMEKTGKAFARTYWFNDDKNTIYFDCLNVDENEREKGIATKLLNTHIQVASDFKVESLLWVKKTHGYMNGISVKDIEITRKIRMNQVPFG